MSRRKKEKRSTKAQVVLPSLSSRVLGWILSLCGVFDQVLHEFPLGSLVSSYFPKTCQ